MTPVEFQKYLSDKLRRLQMEDVSCAMAQAVEAAKRGYNQYECASCKTLMPYKGVKRDHVLPVVATTGFTDWNDFIARLFVPANGIQILCAPCHTAKTIAENSERAIHRRVK